MNHTAGELAEYLRAKIYGDAHAVVCWRQQSGEREAGGVDLCGVAAPGCAG